ncbi:hypothetical protein, partial [Collinsella stercoris]|uniref:hypothetical protein n=1 Tax=Collinsella stercoris TaxID=147206 RepID=UPI003AF058E2
GGLRAWRGRGFEYERGPERGRGPGSGTGASAAAGRGAAPVGYCCALGCAIDCWPGPERCRGRSVAADRGAPEPSRITES